MALAVGAGRQRRAGDAAQLAAVVGVQRPGQGADVAGQEAEQALPEETVRSVVAQLPEVYDAVAARFPDVDLGALWPSSRLR